MKQTSVEKKAVELDKVEENKNLIKVEFGNVESIKIKMLESINQNLMTIIKLLQDKKNG
jgi:hypothetical protein